MSIGLSASIKGASPEIVSAIENASRRTGVDFAYLVDQARAESSFKSDAKAATSSATGLYQFIDSTWLATVKQHGSKHGLDQYASAIQKDFQGRYFVSDDAVRADILNLRKDPKIASLMAAEFASDNQKILEQKTGRDVNATDLYFAHFLGAGGASKFLNELEKNPSGSAATLMPAAARSNKNIFYNSDGSHKSLMQVYNNFSKKFDDSTPVQTVSNAPSPPVEKGYRVEPFFAKNYTSQVNDVMAQLPVIEPLKGGEFFTSLFSVPDSTRMQNQIIDPVSFLMLTTLDVPR